MAKTIINVDEEKAKISTAIQNVIKEIFIRKKKVLLTDKNIDDFKKEIQTFLEILRKKGKIYDYVVVAEFNDLFGFFEFEIAYSLIKSDDAKYQDYLKFTLR